MMPSAENWEERYRTGDIPWDLAGPTPELERLLEESRLPRKGKALVPGGGRGHDAILLAAETELEVDLVDIAPSALTQCLAEAAAKKTVIHAYCQDFFQLPQTAYHQAAYDLLWEYTFFCAIEPERRAEYVKTASLLLKPGAMLAGLFFPLAMDKPGPPFVVSREEVEALFRPFFELQMEEPVRSIKPRKGNEFLGIFRRKP